MDSSQIETPVIKSSQAQVYEKTSSILDVIQIHADQSCTHCIELLKSGFGNAPNPADTVPEPPGNSHV